MAMSRSDAGRLGWLATTARHFNGSAAAHGRWLARMGRAVYGECLPDLSRPKGWPTRPVHPARFSPAARLVFVSMLGSRMTEKNQARFALRDGYITRSECEAIETAVFGYCYFDVPF